MTDINRIRELLVKATPGPWKDETGNVDGAISYFDDRLKRDINLIKADLNGYFVLSNTEDARAIVTMRNELPALLDRLEKLEAVAEVSSALMKRLHTLGWARMDGRDQAPACISHQEFKDLLYRYQQPVDEALSALEGEG